MNPITKSWWIGWGEAALEDIGLEHKDAFLAFVASDPEMTRIYTWQWGLATNLFRAKDTPEFPEMKQTALKQATSDTLCKRLAQLIGGKERSINDAIHPSGS